MKGCDISVNWQEMGKSDRVLKVFTLKMCSQLYILFPLTQMWRHEAQGYRSTVVSSQMGLNWFLLVLGTMPTATPRAGGPRAGPETVWWRNAGGQRDRKTQRQKKNKSPGTSGSTCRPIHHDFNCLFNFVKKITCPVGLKLIRQRRRELKRSSLPLIRHSRWSLSLFFFF